MSRNAPTSTCKVSPTTPGRRVAPSDTAFPHRYDHYDLLVHPATDDPACWEKMIGWARQCWEALLLFVERAVYVNALEDAVEEGERRVRDAYAQLRAAGGLEEHIRPDKLLPAECEHQAGTLERRKAGCAKVMSAAERRGFRRNA